jgi:signal transduction histidine kinase/CheY-like chemotaxis protein
MTRPHRFSDDQARLLSLVAERVAVRIDFASRLEEERSARLDAEAASFAKSELLTVVSNKISSSFRLAQEWTSMLRRSVNGEAALVHMVDAIERGAKARARIIADGLDVLSVIDGTLQLQKQLIEITSLIKASVNSMKSAADEKSIQLQTVLDSSYDLVSGDPDRLKQVFCKLLSNAIKFSPEGGKVRIRFKSVDSFAQVTINDSGKGISKEIFPYLFNLFPPANGPIASKNDTFGLGLGTIQQLIEMHGGTIRADDLREGEGANFVVNLPLAPLPSTLPQWNSDGPELMIKQGCSSKALPRLDGVGILLQEEDPDTRDLLTSALIQRGADTKPLDVIALGALENWQADILVSDLRMPGGVSHKLISKVRALKSEPEEKVSPMLLPARAVVKYWMRALPASSQMALKIPFDTATFIMNAAKFVSKS